MPGSEHHRQSPLCANKENLDPQTGWKGLLGGAYPPGKPLGYPEDQDDSFPARAKRAPLLETPRVSLLPPRGNSRHAEPQNPHVRPPNAMNPRGFPKATPTGAPTPNSSHSPHGVYCHPCQSIHLDEAKPSAGLPPYDAGGPFLAAMVDQENLGLSPQLESLLHGQFAQNTSHIETLGATLQALQAKTERMEQKLQQTPAIPGLIAPSMETPPMAGVPRYTLINSPPDGEDWAMGKNTAEGPDPFGIDQ